MSLTLLLLEGLSFPGLLQLCEVLDLLCLPEVVILQNTPQLRGTYIERSLRLQIYTACAQAGFLEPSLERCVPCASFADFYLADDVLLVELLSKTLSKEQISNLYRYEACVLLTENLLQGLKEEKEVRKMQFASKEEALSALSFIHGLRKEGIRTIEPSKWEGEQIWFTDKNWSPVPESVNKNELQDLVAALDHLSYKIMDLQKSDFAVDEQGCLCLVGGWVSGYQPTAEDARQANQRALQEFFQTKKQSPGKTNTYLKVQSQEQIDDIKQLIADADDEVFEVTVSSSLSSSGEEEDSCEVFDF